MQKTVVFISIAITICTLSGCIGNGREDEISDIFDPQHAGNREYPEWAEFTVERRITITPRNPSAPMSYEVDIPTPRDIRVENPQMQDVISVIASPDSTITQYPDYEWMFWSADDVMGEQTITIQYSVRTESILWTVDPNDSGRVEDIPEWLRERYGIKAVEEWRILHHHPDIVEKSNRLTAGRDNVYDKLKAIFNWMNSEFEYDAQRRGVPRYPNETLQNRRGDCDDQSVLFCALARAADLPAWLELGPFYNEALDSWKGHAWIKVYIPRSTGGGEVYNIDIVNNHFLFRDPYRFTEWESDGNGEHLEDYYYAEGTNYAYSETYQTIEMETSSEMVP